MSDLASPSEYSAGVQQDFAESYTTQLLDQLEPRRVGKRLGSETLMFGALVGGANLFTVSVSLPVVALSMLAGLLCAGLRLGVDVYSIRTRLRQTDAEILEEIGRTHRQLNSKGWVRRMAALSAAVGTALGAVGGLIVNTGAPADLIGGSLGLTILVLSGMSAAGVGGLSLLFRSVHNRWLRGMLAE